LQNFPEVAKCHGLEPRSTSQRKEYKSGISSTASRKTSGVKSIYICNDSTGAKIQEGMEEHLQTSKSSNIITTSYYRVLEMVLSTSQVQQSRPPEESAQARAHANGAKGANRGYDVGRVLMDTGSGINLLYARTLKAMCISLESLKPTECSFYGIVLGGANYPLEKIELDVCFGNSSNYRREKLEFEVMDWPS
jgi:hypothetical protein